MGTVGKKVIRNHYTKRYIEDVFAERLRLEGFACPDDKLLCWYRVVNKEIIQSVCFFSRWSNIPVMLEIAYGIHPLFLRPVSSNDVFFSKPPYDERFYTVGITEGGKRQFAPYTEDISVYAPTAEGRGIWTLTDVLMPQFNSVQTFEECYRFNQRMAEQRYRSFSSTVIDEAIYLDDEDAYSECRAALDVLIPRFAVLCENYPNKKELQEELLQLQLQKQALCEGKREDYLNRLEQKKQKNIAILLKMCGIEV